MNELTFGLFLEALLDNTSSLWTWTCIASAVILAIGTIEYLKHEILKIRYERQRLSLKKRFRHQNSGYRQAAKIREDRLKKASKSSK